MRCNRHRLQDIFLRSLLIYHEGGQIREEAAQTVCEISFPRDIQIVAGPGPETPALVGPAHSGRRGYTMVLPKLS